MQSVAVFKETFETQHTCGRVYSLHNVTKALHNQQLEINFSVLVAGCFHVLHNNCTFLSSTEHVLMMFSVTFGSEVFVTCSD